MTNPTIRDGMIHNAVEQRRVDETKIMQKVNAANREAFVQRFPGQCEHMLRLLSERLHYCLAKSEHIELGQPETWPAGTAELRDLAEAIWFIEQTRQHWPHSAQ